MTANLLERVLETIHRHCMLRAGDVVGVAVSGGSDSVALLRLLEDLRARLGIRLLVVHFNHGLRGAAADADQEFVARLAARRGLELICGREDVAEQAQRHGWNLEDAARRLRYQFFSEVVNSGRATRIAVAHTADDQAETVLAHLVRGTGPAGLAGIYPVFGHVVRPLLEVRRQELRDYLTSLAQDWREDDTNQDCARLRARIRHILLPQLEHDFGAAVVPHLNQLAALAREDEAFWAQLLEDLYRASVDRTSTGDSIRIADLLQPLALGPEETSQARGPEPSNTVAKRLVRRIFEGLKSDPRFGPARAGQLTSRHVEQVLHLATECSSGHRVPLPADIVVERVFDRLVFSPAASARLRAKAGETELSAQPYEYAVELSGTGSATVSVPEIGRRFRLKVIDWSSATSETRAEGKALDAHRLRPPLVLRSCRPGDSYRPVGGRRVRKLKRLLLESRVAVRDRAGWPVLTSASALVWARGLPVAAEFAPGTDTKAGLVIAEEAL
jgi:tRNA(Ile)-lysidine synthase